MANQELEKANLLHIGSQRKTLSKRQKEFNQLTKKIEELGNLIKDLQDGRTQLQQRAQKEMRPLFDRFDAARVELVMTMDRIYPNKIFKKNDHRKLEHLITDMCFELITKSGMDELKEIFNKYNDDDFDTVNAEVDRLAIGAVKDMAWIYGVEFDDDDDISTPEQFHEQMEKKLSEREESYEAEERMRAEKHSKKQKTQKQLDREEKRKAEEQKLTKSVRSVYMDLVKAFHPDREKDEAEKERKTDIMQRVTQAYQENDLMKLLKLQMELDRIDQEHLETLADEQLMYYNKVLKQQLQDLEGQKFEITEELGSMVDIAPYRINSFESVVFAFNRQVNDLKKHVKTVKNELRFWADPPSVKMFLKTYQIPRDDDYDFY